MGERTDLRALVRDFSSEMRQKLLSKEDDGWFGWDDVYAERHKLPRRLQEALMSHVVRAIDDPKQWIDVANFAAFLWNLATREPVPEETNQPEEGG